MAMKIIDSFRFCVDCMVEIETGCTESSEIPHLRKQNREGFLSTHPYLYLYSASCPKKFDNWEQFDAVSAAAKVGKRWKRQLFQAWHEDSLSGELKTWMDKYAESRLSLLREQDFEVEEPEYAEMRGADRDGCIGFKHTTCDCCGFTGGGDWYCVIQMKAVEEGT